MGVTMYRHIGIVLLMLMSFVTILSAQRVMINNAGDRIIMYPDGTWRPIEPGDSVLLNQYIKSSSPASKSVDVPPGTKRTKAEEQAFIMQQWNGLYLDLIAEEKEVQDIFRVATNAQFKASEELSNAESDKKLIEADRLAELKEEYDKSVYHLRLVKLQQKDIRSLVEKGHKINAKPKSISQSTINRLKTSFTIYLSRHSDNAKLIVPSGLPAAAPVIIPSTPAVTTPAPSTPQAQPTPPVTSPSTKPAAETTINKPAPASKPVATVAAAEAYDPKMAEKRPPGADDGPYVSQPYSCTFDTDTIDQATGRNRIELHPEVLFTYTDPDLRPFFKSKDLITCRARLSRIGPYTYLSVEFQIASSHSQSNFGTLAEGSLLRFKLMDGDYISLYNLKTHNGRIDAYTGNTIFTGQYALGKSELKKLKDGEVDTMRVMWSTGYEDYDIYKVDLLIDQLNCLDSKK
jgi:hypothetical protein